MSTRQVPATVVPVVRRDLPLVLSALWDAKCWQESIADAHTLPSHHQSRELTRTANRARKLAIRYERLHDKLRAANLTDGRTDAAAGSGTADPRVGPVSEDKQCI